VSDEFVAPLCRIHHRAVHRVGDERAWWKLVGIDPIKVARNLWRGSRKKANLPGSRSDTESAEVTAAMKSADIGDKELGNDGRHADRSSN
jgi:hypothetical protein